MRRREIPGQARMQHRDVCDHVRPEHERYRGIERELERACRQLRVTCVRERAIQIAQVQCLGRRARAAEQRLERGEIRGSPDGVQSLFAHGSRYRVAREPSARFRFDGRVRELRQHGDQTLAQDRVVGRFAAALLPADARQLRREQGACVAAQRIAARQVGVQQVGLRELPRDPFEHRADRLPPARAARDRRHRNTARGQRRRARAYRRAGRADRPASGARRSRRSPRTRYVDSACGSNPSATD